MQHMLFLCPRINVIWGNISKSLHIDICGRLLVCGSIQRDYSTTKQCQNMILSYTMYSIFIQNVESKYEKKNYKNIDMKMNIRLYLAFQKTGLLRSQYNSKYMYVFERVIDNLEL